MVNKTNNASHSEPLAQPCLTLSGLTVRYGSRLVLADVNATIAGLGVHVIMGPGGAGKTTLLRTLCQPERMTHVAHVDGSIRYWGAPLSETHHPRFVTTNPRALSWSVFDVLRELWPHRGTFDPAAQRAWAATFCTQFQAASLIETFDTPLVDLPAIERQRVMLLHTVASIVDEPSPALICLDEPMRGLDDVETLCETIEAVGDVHPLLLVTHHRARARRLASTAALLAGGQLHGQGDAAVFFSDRAPDVVEHFIRTGGCPLPSPNATPELLDPAFADKVVVSKDVAVEASDTPAPVTPVPSAFQGPRNFRWVIPGRLAGTPQPGLIESVEHDLDALRRVGVDTLVTLTETHPLKETLEQAGFTSLWLPIDDGYPPTVDEATALCQSIQAHLDQGAVVALHCHAGVGRTGTLIAAYFVTQGLSADDAITRVRQADHRYIQTTRQEEFLAVFALETRTSDTPSSSLVP